MQLLVEIHTRPMFFSYFAPLHGIWFAVNPFVFVVGFFTQGENGQSVIMKRKLITRKDGGIE